MRKLTPQYRYKVVTGDTLSKIAAEFGTTVKELLDCNPIINQSGVLFTGQEVKLPECCYKSIEMYDTIVNLQCQLAQLQKEKDRAWDGFEGQGRRLYELCINAGANPGNVKNWLAELIEHLHKPLPIPSGYQLAPKMLTSLMAERIRQGASNQRFVSWPANCWENALDAAPAITVSLRDALGFPPAGNPHVVRIPDAEISIAGADGEYQVIKPMTDVDDKGCRGEPGLEHRWVQSTGGHHQMYCSKCGATQGPELTAEEKLAWINKFTENFQ